jgi:pimeloyl-ACP methyl ester carboxylesterase
MQNFKTKSFIKLMACGLIFAFLNACGGGGGGSVPEQTSVPVAVNASVGSTLISNAGGIVTVNGSPVVELSASASTSPSTVTVQLRPSTTGGLTDEVVIDLSAAVPSSTDVSEVSVYIYPTSVKQAVANAQQKASVTAANGALGLTATIDTFTFAGSTVPYRLDQLDVIGTTGANIKLLASRLVYDPAKAAIKATFTAASAAVTTVKAINGLAKEFVANVVVKNNDNTARLYHFPSLNSVGTEITTSATATKIPLVLVHGIQLLSEGCGSNRGYKGTWDKFRANFYGDADVSSKYDLYSFSYPTNIDFRTNGRSLSQKLSAVFGNKPVVVVAHSMGGLVTRAADVYYSTKLQSGGATDINIARVITLDTPHHGTPYVNSAATLSEVLCLGNAQSAGGPSLAWDDLENNASCTNSRNPLLCELNSPQNLQHLKKYVPYSAYGVLGTISSYAGTNVHESMLLLSTLTSSLALLKNSFTQGVIDNYFSSDVAKKSDIAVLLPSQRLMSYVSGQWVDNPSLFDDLPDVYPSTLHIDLLGVSVVNPGIASSAKVWNKKADGTPGGIRSHLSGFALQLTGKPDLIPSAVTVSPASVQPGGVVTVAWQMANSGNANAAASTTGLRLLSAATSGNGVAANQVLNVPTGALAAGGVANQSQAITIPAGTAPGSYVVVVVADNVATSTLGQSNVANDYARSSAFTVATSTPTTTPTTPTVATGRLNDTGITASQCYQAGSDVLVSCTSAAAIALNAYQDGMLGRDVSNADSTDGALGFSYTKIAANGSIVPATASAATTPWECVKDNVTGLMWENKNYNFLSPLHLRDAQRTYTNYGDGRVGDTSEFVAKVNAQGLCGYTNWRLPTVDELQSIVDYSKYFPNPTIDSNFFQNTQLNWFWSSSSYVGFADVAWFVRFFDGVVWASSASGGSNSSDRNYVRLVRASQ